MPLSPEERKAIEEWLEFDGLQCSSCSNRTYERFTVDTVALIKANESVGEQVYRMVLIICQACGQATQFHLQTLLDLAKI